MAKFHSIDEVKPRCERLRQAYEVAFAGAFDRIPRPESGIRWPGKFGNHVSTKGTLIGLGECAGCGKKVEVILNLDPIQATD